ncbi:transcriptional regulator family: Fungal Specific TF [Penicillium roqueforti]|uniref:transcriptional regulator family: Fungal Specific TF n=1 Tax=Penicillium roqueforti TaxID=5082 RepID=UPI00190D4582|nr:transcriptional regulator family: Fungal Specific TF [Penicillium roqueforti]KAF9251892.1 transcriptional regulator family: Fungal Specific TF [Penicillium roqueforti]KAI2690053.1 transcriptional regulator family: Fungal Specific TF [Penicillium roqueforti]KAI2702571.1 transcriptional regulator family: Fungal Specific TF [Penicillium roqueforti]KAI3144945.1 transcriptional regulator family: Fungal Specific TF [Penicillium roqueforti]KAI3163023.1 transcriptional regulator family: Fungal Spec
MQNVLFFFIEVAFCMVTIVSAQIPESDTVLQVQYGSVTFKTGEKLRLSDITSAPSIGLSAPALTGTYIVIMIDPDAPDPTLPIFTQVLHWVQQDLIFSPMAGKYNTFVPLITPSPAPAAAPYLPPMPPPLLAPHSNSSENTHQQKQSRPGGYEANTSPANPDIQHMSVQTTSKKVSCTSCRQRKIKCDKENPCSQCTSSFYDCIYPESSRKRRRKLPLERIESLESRLKAIESSISTNAESSPMIPSSMTSEIGNITNKTPLATPNEHTAPAELGNRDKVYHAVEQDEIEFQGYSADRSFIQCLNAKLGDWRGGDMTWQQLPSRISAPAFFEVEGRTPARVTLPERDIAARLVDAALDAQILLCLVHRPSFEVSFNLVYSLEEANYSAKEQKFLPLLYAIFAYGCLVIDPGSYGPDCDKKVSQGLEFYAKSRQLQNLAECRDLTSLQAIMFLNLFLLSSNRISTCYTYLSASLSIALRMGLHRSLKTGQDLISEEMSKRIFWTLRLLVNDVATASGMPVLLSDDEIDQELPKETNDINIEKMRISPQPRGEICYISGANSYKRLQMVRDKVTHCVYSLKGQTTSDMNGLPIHGVSLALIHGIQGDLDNWVDDIPMGYRLGTCYTEARLIRAQFILAMSYAHVQLYLYRPFLHYAVRSLNEQVGMSTYATASVRASENIIALCEGMYGQDLLKGDLWPVTHMLTSSILTILYFVVVSRASPKTDMLLGSLIAGRRVLNHLAEHSLFANRGKVMLTIMISTLPGTLRHIQEKLLRSDTQELPGLQNERLASYSGPFDNALNSRLASETFSLSPKQSPVGSLPASTAAEWGANPSKSLNSSTVLSDSQWNPRVSNAQHSTIGTFQQDLAGTSEFCKAHDSSNESNSHPIIGEDQTYPRSQNLEEMGVIDEFLQAQPLNLQQDCIDETWFSALKMAGLDCSDDFQSSISRLECLEQTFDFDG